MSDTLIHKRVRLAEEGENPTTNGRMESGWLVLGDVQNLLGYCVLLGSPVVASINKLDEEGRAIFSNDLWHIGDALLSITDAHRVNYSVLGNLDGALHAHITPRYHTESDATRGKMLPSRHEDPIEFNLDDHSDIMASIRTFLVNRGAMQ